MQEMLLNHMITGLQKNRYMWWLLIIAFLGALLLLSRSHFEIRHEIEIRASVPQVWQAIIDFENYKRWNTQLEYLGGEVRPGGQLRLKLSAEGASSYEFESTISRWQENEKFAWLARTGISGIFDGEHFFELKT